MAICSKMYNDDNMGLGKFGSIEDTYYLAITLSRTIPAAKEDVNVSVQECSRLDIMQSYFGALLVLKIF